MTKERYLGVWSSVNDIQVQAGKERWEKVLIRGNKPFQQLEHFLYLCNRMKLDNQSPTSNQ